MSEGFEEQDLTQPLPGSAAAAAAEGAAGPAVGRDEWVARHGEHRLARVTGGLEALHLAGLWRFQPHLSRQSINPLRIAQRSLL